MGFLNKLLVLVTLTTLLSFISVEGQQATEKYSVEPYGRAARARGVALDDAGDLLYVSEVSSSITSAYEENGNISQIALATRPDLQLTHGIAYRNGRLYASSESTVYRWTYTPGQRQELDNQEEIVVKDIPDSNNWGHITRTLIFDRNDLLYVCMGAKTNVDGNSSFARIKRFNISALPSGGISWEDGELFADGTRNNVGLALDLDGIMWGVDNGADDLFREDLGGDIHNTNPGDEMFKFDQEPGSFYGYPYCWSVDELEGHERGKQMAWPDFMNDSIHSDTWCQNNALKPTLTLPAHWAALGITFYNGTGCNSGDGAFPCNMTGDAFVTFHGSWNREPPSGYKVVRIPIDQGMPVGTMEEILFEPDTVGCTRCFRPVDLVFDGKGRLLVTADLGVSRVKYVG